MFLPPLNIFMFLLFVLLFSLFGVFGSFFSELSRSIGKSCMVLSSCSWSVSDVRDTVFIPMSIWRMNYPKSNSSDWWFLLCWSLVLVPLSYVWSFQVVLLSFLGYSLVGERKILFFAFRLTVLHFCAVLILLCDWLNQREAVPSVQLLRPGLLPGTETNLSWAFSVLNSCFGLYLMSLLKQRQLSQANLPQQRGTKTTTNP